MVIGIPKEIEVALKIQNRDYQDGYIDGFECAKREIVKELNKMKKGIEKMEALVTSSSTSNL